MNIENLKKKESHVFNDKTADEVVEIVRQSKGEFIILPVDEGLKVMRKTNKNIEKLVFTICNELNYFQSKIVNAEFATVRALVGQYNKYKDTKIKVKSIDNVVYIYKNIDLLTNYDEDETNKIKLDFKNHKL